MHVFCKAVKAGRLSSLRSLNLIRTGLDDDPIESLSAALFSSAQSLSIDTLVLGGLVLAREETMSGLFRKDTLPRLRVLVLAGSLMSPFSLRGLAATVETGKMPCLEVLDLSKVDKADWQPIDDAVASLVSVLKDSVVPYLKTLNLKGLEVGGAACNTLVSNLLSGDRAPLDTLLVSLCFRSGMEEETATALGSGKVHCLRSLEVEIKDNDGLATGFAFLNACLTAPQNPEKFSLSVRSILADSSHSIHFLNSLVEALQRRRLDRLSRLEMVRVECFSGHSEGMQALGKALMSKKMSGMRTLSFRCCRLVDGGMVVLGEVVRRGHLSHLECLCLNDNVIGEEGMNAFFGAISERGLRALKILSLAHTRAGAGVGALVAALRAGKMPSMRELGMGHCGLTDAGLHLLASAFRENRVSALTALFLEGNSGVSKKGWTKFFEILLPQSLPHLEKLLRILPHTTKAKALAEKAQKEKKLRTLTLF
uniref:Uncharacterized protein n=1 Tax=Chromera velia CCMP2878 TaxID=1169474 RepID=A0A0G4GJF3_9ALVE|eukprot:Cvel_22137.t1-p1 / transcript=Cvel_22137.t1 / gene=Cvel_22137 / organism=Chromera_velia_CCMP2878 / gene_product=hypothetical protein / transcript_product=hypothetical protein / location=Cvel_scaffold2147:4610-6379(+) / protein_length=480 / sequence_SO=supercontig / SO=protein_coding / is_pseudo=false